MRKAMMAAFGLVALVATLGFGAVANAAVSTVYSQDFSDGTEGWFDASNGWYGTIAWNETAGTATVEGDPANDDTGPFSRFDGYRDTWPGDWMAEVDVYLDPAWEAGTGFDYSVAASGIDGQHQRDFIFHVAVDEAGLWVGGTNNTSFEPRARTVNAVDIDTAGWYTLQHVFANVDGTLAVTMNVLDAEGDTVFSTVRSAAADTIPDVVGGNRYAWFTYVTTGGVEIDNHSLSIVVPGPGTKDDCKQGGFAAFGYENQGQCVASVQAAVSAGK